MGSDINMQCIATFDTTHMALKFEKKCRTSGMDVRVIPVPRELSSSCGFACSFPCEVQSKIDSLIASSKIEVAGFHTLDENI